MNYSFWKHGWFPVVWWGGATLVLLLNLPGSSTLEMVRNTMFWLVAVVLPASHFYQINLANRALQFTNWLGFVGEKEPIFVVDVGPVILNPWLIRDKKKDNTPEGINLEAFDIAECLKKMPEGVHFSTRNEKGLQVIPTRDDRMSATFYGLITPNVGDLKTAINFDQIEALRHMDAEINQLLSNELNNLSSDYVHEHKEEIQRSVEAHMLNRYRNPCGYRILELKVDLLDFSPEMAKARVTVGVAEKINKAAEKILGTNTDRSVSWKEAKDDALTLHGTVTREIRQTVFGVDESLKGVANVFAGALARRRSKKRGR